MKSVPLFILILIGLAACNTPGPHFRGLTATLIEVNGSLFEVRVRGEMAEAMRINPEYAPRFGPIRARAALAMSAVSGCEVKDVLGDQALATGVLKCPSGPHETQQLLPPGCIEKNKPPPRTHDLPIRILSCEASS
jgi:hypothetical protein